MVDWWFLVEVSKDLKDSCRFKVFFLYCMCFFL